MSYQDLKDLIKKYKKELIIISSTYMTTILIKHIKKFNKNKQKIITSQYDCLNEEIQNDYVRRNLHRLFSIEYENDEDDVNNDKISQNYQFTYNYEYQDNQNLICLCKIKFIHEKDMKSLHLHIMNHENIDFITINQQSIIFLYDKSNQKLIIPKKYFNKNENENEIEFRLVLKSKSLSSNRLILPYNWLLSNVSSQSKGKDRLLYENKCYYESEFKKLSLINDYTINVNITYPDEYSLLFSNTKIFNSCEVNINPNTNLCSVNQNNKYITKSFLYNKSTSLSSNYSLNSSYFFVLYNKSLYESIFFENIFIKYEKNKENIINQKVNDYLIDLITFLNKIYSLILNKVESQINEHSKIKKNIEILIFNSQIEEKGSFNGVFPEENNINIYIEGEILLIDSVFLLEKKNFLNEMTFINTLVYYISKIIIDSLFDMNKIICEGYEKEILYNNFSREALDDVFQLMNDCYYNENTNDNLINHTHTNKDNEFTFKSSEFSYLKSYINSKSKSDYLFLNVITEKDRFSSIIRDLSEDSHSMKNQKNQSSKSLLVDDYILNNDEIYYLKPGFILKDNKENSQLLTSIIKSISYESINKEYSLQVNLDKVLIIKTQIFQKLDSQELVYVTTNPDVLLNEVLLTDIEVLIIDNENKERIVKLPIYINKPTPTYIKLSEYEIESKVRCLIIDPFNKHYLITVFDIDSLNFIIDSSYFLDKQITLKLVNDLYYLVITNLLSAIHIITFIRNILKFNHSHDPLLITYILSISTYVIKNFLYENDQSPAKNYFFKLISEKLIFKKSFDSIKGNLIEALLEVIDITNSGHIRFALSLITVNNDIMRIGVSDKESFHNRHQEEYKIYYLNDGDGNNQTRVNHYISNINHIANIDDEVEMKNNIKTNNEFTLRSNSNSLSYSNFNNEDNENDPSSNCVYTLYLLDLFCSRTTKFKFFSILFQSQFLSNTEKDLLKTFLFTKCEYTHEQVLYLFSHIPETSIKAELSKYFLSDYYNNNNLSKIFMSAYNSRRQFPFLLKIYMKKTFFKDFAYVLRNYNMDYSFIFYYYLNSSSVNSIGILEKYSKILGKFEGNIHLNPQLALCFENDFERMKRNIRICNNSDCFIQNDSEN